MTRYFEQAGFKDMLEEREYFDQLMLQKQQRNDRFYMDLAIRTGEQSYAERSKVGAVMVRGDNVIALGYNGTPSGWNNRCEEPSFLCELDPDTGTCDCPEDEPCPVEMVTKKEVLHAESNLIAKVARSTQSSGGATVYVTLSPCMDCAKQLYQAGIVRLVYADEYRDTSGLEFLKKAGVEVEQLSAL